MRISSTRWLLAAAGAVGLLGVYTSRAAPQDSKPFPPEVDDFVAVYLENGGGKLDDWVRGDTTKRPDETLRAFKTLPGLSMELVASEPVIRQPVDLHFDDRGRLWVVQYLQYPFPAGLNITSCDQCLRARYNGVPAPPPNGVRGADKITVLEDRDGDGVFESHQDLITGLNITTSALSGHGGLWVMNPPPLLSRSKRRRIARRLRAICRKRSVRGLLSILREEAGRARLRNRRTGVRRWSCGTTGWLAGAGHHFQRLHREGPCGLRVTFGGGRRGWNRLLCPGGTRGGVRRDWRLRVRTRD